MITENCSNLVRLHQRSFHRDHWCRPHISYQEEHLRTVNIHVKLIGIRSEIIELLTNSDDIINFIDSATLIDGQLGGEEKQQKYPPD